MLNEKRSRLQVKTYQGRHYVGITDLRHHLAEIDTAPINNYNEVIVTKYGTPVGKWVPLKGRDFGIPPLEWEEF